MSDHAPRVACVWNIPGAPIRPLPYGAHIGTWSLAPVCGFGVLWWSVGENPPAEVHDYEVLLVHLFGDMEHVTQLREAGYRGVIVAIPDSYFDTVFRDGSQYGFNFLRQLQAADVIGVVSDSNEAFYRPLLNKPTLRIPHPIGTDAFFEAARGQYRENTILAVGHADAHSPRPLDYDMPTIAALAAIQRKTGLHIDYVNANDDAIRYCAMLGIKATFYGRMVYQDYVRFSGRARLGVDLYPLHGMGRNELTWAYAGLPYVAGSFTQGTRGEISDPWDVADAVTETMCLLEDRAYYDAARERNLQYVIENHTFDACLRQMEDQFEVIEHVRQSLCA